YHSLVTMALLSALASAASATRFPYTTLFRSQHHECCVCFAFFINDVFKLRYLDDATLAHSQAPCQAPMAGPRNWVNHSPYAYSHRRLVAPFTQSPRRALNRHAALPT